MPLTCYTRLLPLIHFTQAPGLKILKVDSQICPTNIVQYVYSVFGSPLVSIYLYLTLFLVQISLLPLAQNRVRARAKAGCTVRTSKILLSWPFDSRRKWKDFFLEFWTQRLQVTACGSASEPIPWTPPPTCFPRSIYSHVSLFFRFLLPLITPSC